MAQALPSRGRSDARPVSSRSLLRQPWRSAALRIALNIGAFMVLFQAYKMVRMTFSARSAAIGTSHAERLIGWEKSVHLFSEPGLQRWAISHEWLIRALNWTYFLFMPAFYAYCAIGIVFAPAAFRHLRRVFFCSMLLALPWFALFPLAPPRFMSDHGLTDTLARFGPVADTGGGLVKANQYAAMPSMHIGWTTIGACMVALSIRNHALGRAAGTAIVAWMCLTVMATGNHYVFDILGGWLIVLASFALARWSERHGPFAIEIAPKLPRPTLLTQSQHRDKSISRPAIRPETSRAGREHSTVSPTKQRPGKEGTSMNTQAINRTANVINGFAGVPGFDPGLTRACRRRT